MEKEYTYTNPNYYSKVNDFGDDYHKPDREDASGFGKEFMRKLRSLKRKYRDFREYVEAKEIYNRYAEYLIEKYGGKKKLALYYQSGLMREYMPFCPELRFIKKNKKYIKGAPLVEYENSELEIVPHTELDLDNMKEYFPDFGSTKKFDVKLGMEFFRSDIRETINQDLELIDKFYRGRVKHASHLNHKARRRKIMEDRYSHKDEVPAKQKYKEYLERLWNYDYEEDRYDPNLYVYYKDTSVTAEESRNIEVYNWLHERGIRASRKSLSKHARQVVRRNTVFNGGKKKVKKKKKGKKIMKTKYMKDLTGQKYNTWKDFERDMQQLTADHLRNFRG